MLIDADDDDADDDDEDENENDDDWCRKASPNHIRTRRSNNNQCFWCFCIVLAGVGEARTLQKKIRTRMDTFRAGLTLPNIRNSWFDILRSTLSISIDHHNCPFCPRSSELLFLTSMYYNIGSNSTNSKMKQTNSFFGNLSDNLSQSPKCPVLCWSSSSFQDLFVVRACSLVFSRIPHQYFWFSQSSDLLATLDFRAEVWWGGRGRGRGETRF